MANQIGVLPIMTEQELDADYMRCVFRLDADNPSLEGHFPGLPVLAGVIQLHWAMLLAAKLGFSAEAFRSSPRVKFKMIAEPPLDMQYEIFKKSDGRFSYRLSSALGLHSEGSFS